MEVIWLGPNAFVTGDPTLEIRYPTAAGPAATVTCNALMPKPKSISVTLPVPPRAVIEQIVVCYRVSDDRSSIARTRLLEMTTPDTATVRFDDATPRQSTSPVCFAANIAGITPAGTLNLELQLDFADLAHTITLGGIGVGIASDCATERNDHTLGEFGSYATAADAYTTFAKALDDIAKQGGGVLCIPHDAPAGFVARNLPKNAGVDQNTVTVIDYRQGVEHTYVPPVGITNSDASAVAGRLIERDLAVTLPWQNVFSVVDLSSRCPGGASSVSMQLTQNVSAGTGQKVHVPTLRGTFRGQQLLIATATPGVDEMITVNDLGIDAQGPFLVADLTSGHSAKDRIYNKNNVASLNITDTSNCDTQSASLQLTRTTYGSGDTFGIAAILRYQGNINSAGGDEGGVAIAANLEHDIDCFYGEVEHWDAMNHLLRYKSGFVAPQTLGTSRPIINLNPGKHVTAGTVTVVAPGGSPLRLPSPSPSNDESIGFIAGDAMASAAWSSALVNRFIAIDEPTESYERPSPAGGGATVTLRRWWLITKLEPRPDGTKNLYVERAVADAVSNDGGPTLFLASNYSRALKYIIAPGAWASDVREGVAGNMKGNVGFASPADLRTIKLAPAPTDGTPQDFAAGDAITNPPGPDVWIPTGFRVRNVPHYPGGLPGISFLSENLGTVQMGAGLSINGSGDSSNLGDVHDRMKDASAEYDSGILIIGSTHKGIVIRGAVEDTAIELWGSNDNPKIIRWLDAAATIAGQLHVDPASRDFIVDTSRDFVVNAKRNFIFNGADLDLTGGSTFHQNGISGTGDPAANLGGRSVPVAAAALNATVMLQHDEKDTAYSVFVQCSWQTTSIITGKTQKQFGVEFGAGPPMGGGTFDWFLMRLP